MPTTTKDQLAPPIGIDPDRLYNYADLSVVTGLSARKIKREVEEGRMGYVASSPARYRLVEGQQFLDWKASRRVSPEAA